MMYNFVYHCPEFGSCERQLCANISDMGKEEIQKLAPAKPFVKWVGGKRNIIEELTSRMPESFDGYYEPFVGGGALFWELQPSNAHLSDVNLRLIITYTAIRDRLDDVIGFLRIAERKHDKEFYLAARERLSTATDAAEIAALFIYLNKTCYNGLYRVNRKGGFNVPMGKYKNPAILDGQNLRLCSLALQGVDIKQRPFYQAEPQPGAFYYFDPPYHSTYDGYSNDGFGDDEHELLAGYCRLVDKDGGKFMVSNSDTEFVRKLYSGYNIEQIQAGRYVSCKGDGRGKENELVIRNYE